jgi:hypothetical protein
VGILDGGAILLQVSLEVQSGGISFLPDQRTQVDDCSLSPTKGEGARLPREAKVEIEEALMLSLTNLKNYWLDRIEKRKEEKAKQKKLINIVENVSKRIKVLKGKK